MEKKKRKKKAQRKRKDDESNWIISEERKMEVRSTKEERGKEEAKLNKREKERSR